MLNERGHRKRVRHYDEPGHFHELTFSCYRRMPLLTNDVWRAMLSVSIDRAVKGHSFRLSAFVFMPEHVHLLVFSCRWYIEEGQYRDEALPTVKSYPAEFWDNAGRDKVKRISTPSLGTGWQAASGTRREDGSLFRGPPEKGGVVCGGLLIVVWGTLVEGNVEEWVGVRGRLTFEEQPMSECTE